MRRNIMFHQNARALECDEDKERFEVKLREGEAGK